MKNHALWINGWGRGQDLRCLVKDPGLSGAPEPLQILPPGVYSCWSFFCFFCRHGACRTGTRPRGFVASCPAQTLYLVQAHQFFSAQEKKKSNCAWAFPLNTLPSFFPLFLFFCTGHLLADLIAIFNQHLIPINSIMSMSQKNYSRNAPLQNHNKGGFTFRFYHNLNAGCRNDPGGHCRCGI